MAYTTIKKPSDYFNTKIYTGDGSSSRAITGIGFEPSLTWNKPRTTANDHQLVDAVRGGGKVISSNLADAEYTAGNTILSFNSDGFTCGDGASVNVNGVNYASWNWKAGTTSIPSGSSTAPTAVSINATAGFGIYEYTGTGVTGRTLAHGLNSAPKMMIVKRLNSTRNWGVYHSSLANTEYLELNTTTAKQTGNWWGNTTPTSSLIYLGNDGATNGSSDPFIMYAFAEKQGYSKFGSYTGNGNADGTFVYTGFKPAFVMVKATGLVKNWCILDNKRDGYNPQNEQLHPNTSGAETMGSGSTGDLLSNGFKWKVTDDDKNGSGATYIYMAFASEPLVGDNPATAR
jgi:hypothetical protein